MNSEVSAPKSKRKALHSIESPSVASGKFSSRTLLKRRVAVIPLAADPTTLALLSGVLRRLGCAEPEPVPSPDSHTTMGTLLSIVELNARLLEPQTDELPSWKLRPLANEVGSLGGLDYANATLEAIVGDFELFQISFPAIPWLLPFWRSALEAAQIDHFALHLLSRPPTNEGIDDAATTIGILRWLNYVLEAERNTRGMRRFFATDSSLISDVVSFAEDTQKAFDLYWPSQSTRIERDIAAFIADWKAERPSIRQIDNRGFEDNWATQVYNILLAWIADKENSADYDELDRVYSEFINSCAILTPLINNKVISTNRIATLEKSLNFADNLYLQSKDHHELQITGLKVAIADLSATNNSLTNSMKDAKTLIDARDESINTLDSALSVQVGLLKDADEALGKITSENSKLARAATEANVLILEREKTLSALDAALFLKDELLTQANTALVGANADMERLLKNHDLERAEAAIALQNTSLKLDEFRQSKAKIESQRERDRILIAELKQNLKASEDRLLDRDEKVTTLANQLVEMEAAVKRDQTRIGKLNQDLTGSQDKLLDCDHKVKTLSQQLSETESKLRHFQLQADQLGQDLTSALKAVTAEKYKHNDAVSQLHAQRGRIDTLIDETESQANMRFQELAALTQMLLLKEKELVDTRMQLKKKRRISGYITAAGPSLAISALFRKITKTVG